MWVWSRLTVAGLLGGRAVIAQAVGLDDQAVVGEEEVDFVAEDPVFGERDREAGGEGERAEEDLEVRVGEPEGVPVEERRAASSRPASPT